MSTSAELKRVMIMNLHKVPNDSGYIKLHYNPKNGKMWCYCESCHAIGGLKDDGTMFGLATRENCRGASAKDVRVKTDQMY